ncbi:hypothetical protein D3C76_863420 [compost metagenome]
MQFFRESDFRNITTERVNFNLSFNYCRTNCVQARSYFNFSVCFVVAIVTNTFQSNSVFCVVNCIFKCQDDFIVFNLDLICFMTGRVCICLGNRFNCFVEFYSHFFKVFRCSGNYRWSSCVFCYSE